MSRGHHHVASPGVAIEHVPALDGLRGLAIALVLLVHFVVIADFPGRLPGGLSDWLNRLSYAGWVGVDLFFVLSGFLITSILLASRADPLYFRRFYGRRALRIFPLYVTALTIGLVALPLLAPALAPVLLVEAQHQQVWLWTYTLNIANAFGWLVNAGVLAQMWTLAIEEQFYVVWPWVVRRLTLRQLANVCGVLIVSALILRVAWLRFASLDGWPGAYRFTLTRVDALAVGAAIALARQDVTGFVSWDRWAPRILLACLAVLGVWFVAAQRFYPDQPGVVTYGHSLLALTFGCLLVLGLRDRAPGWMCQRWLRALGKYSYGIYVWHWPLQNCLVIYGGTLHPVTFVCAGLIGSILLGALSYWILERPFLLLKTAFSYESPRTLST
jgi:peptidoglycan/LPS O-acetylase OafA/YrhL